jgi:peptidoglycan hydrolase-like protein with peptidoglycan-binding domain
VSDRTSIANLALLQRGRAKLGQRLGRRSVRSVGAVASAGLLVALGAFLFGGSKQAASVLVPTSEARIVRTDVIERQQVAGTLDYAGSFAVANGPTAGIVTWLPTAGTIVRRGAPLFELSRSTVPLLYGSRPAYRELALGMSDGPDVGELKQNLIALGFNAAGALTLDDSFDLATLAAVEQLQRSLGLQPTGVLAQGSVVFLPGAVRVSANSAVLGASVQAGAPILTATATTPAVLVPLDPGSVSQLRVGDRVIVTMPDQSSVPGHVASIGRVATSSSSSGQGGGQGSSAPTVPVTITLLRQAGGRGLDQAPVQVAITTQEDRGVLAVPISALLALPGGGYAVQVKDARLTRLVPVTTGLFDDVAGRVEIRGEGLRPGMHVEVPAQ